MSVQTFLNEVDKQSYKTRPCYTIQSDDILAYQLLKSANLSYHHEELATIPELRYNYLKDQYETEDTLLAEEFNHMSNQHGRQERVTAEPKYNLFSSNNQHIYKNEFVIYYIKENNKHYNQQPVNRLPSTTYHNKITTKKYEILNTELYEKKPM